MTVKSEELGWLFENCFPNTLDTTVFHEVKNGRPDTCVITGDIDAMWLRASSTQVWPYLRLIQEDMPLQQLIAGAINRQARCVLKDPYANAFCHTDDKVGEWVKDHTDISFVYTPGIQAIPAVPGAIWSVIASFFILFSNKVNALQRLLCPVFVPNLRLIDSFSI